MDVATRARAPVWERIPLATTITGIIVACVVAMSILQVLNRHQDVDTSWFANTVIGLGLGGVGSLLAHKVPRNPIGWLMLTAGFMSSTMNLGREWAVYVTMGHRSLPGATFGGWWGTWPYVVSLATMPLVLLLFPDGMLPSRRWRAVVWALGASMVMGITEVMFMSEPFTDDMPSLVNPLGIDWVGFPVIGTIGRIGFALCVVAALASLAVRAHRADAQTRQQLRWGLFGGSVLGLEVLLEAVPWPGDHSFFNWAGPLALVVFLGCLGVAVLRYRLWDLNLLLRMSLVYGVLIAIVTVVYVAVVVAMGNLADHEVPVGPSLIAAALGVAVFALLRDRVNRGVERIFYGDRSDPYRALSALGQRLDQPDPAEAVLDEVVDAVRQSLRLGRVAITVPGSGEVAATGDVGGTAVELPLVFRDTQVGALVVVPRPGGRLGRSEMSVLADLARPVAAVLHAVAVSEELQRSRRALVTAREAERRRVRRNLHDGLGPALAAVRMKLDSAAILIDSDPQAAREVIAQLAADIRSTIADIRRLVHDLQPPELDELGLLQALGDQTRRFSGPLEDGQVLEVDLHAPSSLPELPAAVEVAAYRIACEALANVERHSHASRCRVDLACNGDLILCVDDDGIGMSEDPERGLGTVSMTERAAELGGTVRFVGSPMGGTRVEARLPVRPKDLRTASVVSSPPAVALQTTLAGAGAAIDGSAS